MNWQERLRSCAESTSAHGFAEILESRKIWRLIWITLVLTGIGVTLWQIITLFSSYLNGKKYTTLTDQYYVEQLEFPDIVVCEQNPFTKSRVEKLGLPIEALGLLQVYLLPPMPSNPTAQDIARMLRVFQEWSVKKGNNYTVPQLYHLLGRNCRDLIQGCRLGFSDFDCCALAQPLLTIFGRCWTVPLVGSQNVPGRQSGIRISFKVDIDDRAELPLGTMLGDGLLVSINDRVDTYFLREPVVNVQPGTTTSFALSKTVKYLEDSHLRVFAPPCEKNAKLKCSTAPYTREACHTDCFLQVSNASCGCAMGSSATLVPSVKSCGMVQAFTCLVPLAMRMQASINKRNVTAKTAADPAMKALLECSEQCGEPCERTTTYDIHAMSVIQFPGKASAKSMNSYLMSHMPGYKNGSLFEYANLMFGFGQISYRELAIAEMTPFDQMVSNVGGQLGLWIGASVLTLVQACWLCSTGKCCSNSVKDKENEDRNGNVSKNGAMEMQV